MANIEGEFEPPKGLGLRRGLVIGERREGTVTVEVVTFVFGGAL